MAGHLHDQIFYKWLGTDAAKKLGSRDMKWTDPEVVETLQFVQDLIDAGAFDKKCSRYDRQYCNDTVPAGRSCDG